jgi:hypothetical protein
MICLPCCDDFCLLDDFLSADFHGVDMIEYVAVLRTRYEPPGSYFREL